MKAPDSLARLITHQLTQSQGWIGFDRFMALALYAPGLGYYSRSSPKLGHMPDSGSDFVTAPELSPWFGRALSRSVAEALQHTGTDEVWEFGAGTGALAQQVLDTIGSKIRAYHIIDLSGSLRERQETNLAKVRDRVYWHELV